MAALLAVLIRPSIYMNMPGIAPSALKRMPSINDQSFVPGVSNGLKVVTESFWHGVNSQGMSLPTQVHHRLLFQ